jgi:hypothetical protein
VLRLLLAMFSNLVELFILWNSFCLCLGFSSGDDPLPGCCFCLGVDGPDEAQQFASECSDDFSLILSVRCQPAVAFVQVVPSRLSL